MKSGVRALGVAESFAREATHSTLAGAVVRADRTVDGIAFSTCTVGGSDVTDAVVDCYRRLDREDVRYVLVAGVALAWYNLLEPGRLREAVDRPVIAVTFEASPGLEDALRDAFEGEALDRRLERYRALPPREATTVNGEDVFYRAVGLPDDEAEAVLEAFTPEGGRPEPLRVARFAARAGDDLRRDAADGDGQDDEDGTVPSDDGAEPSPGDSAESFPSDGAGSSPGENAELSPGDGADGDR